MTPRVRIEPSTLPIAVDFVEGRHHEADDGSIVIVDGRAEAVSRVIRLDVSGGLIRYELDTWAAGSPDLTVMHVAETSRLFLGGRRSSCVVDLSTMTVDHRFEHGLFWGFDREARPGYVLEVGELDCLFRALDGRVLGSVPVDPPWERFVEPEGFRFESLAHGSQRLSFPRVE